MGRDTVIKTLGIGFTKYQLRTFSDPAYCLGIDIGD